MSRTTRFWTQVPPGQSSFSLKSLLPHHPLQLILIPLSSLYTNRTWFYPALTRREACFERVCVAAEDDKMAINNEEEGCWETQAAGRTKKSCRWPPQLWTQEWRYCKFYHGCQRCVILAYLTDLLAWASNLQLLYAAFNSVTYLYSGHIVIYSLRVLDGGKPCLRLDIDKVYSRKRKMSHMLKTPNHSSAGSRQCGHFDLLVSILSRPNHRRTATWRSVSRRRMSSSYTGSPLTLL